jgi:hypothetical protein
MTGGSFEALVRSLVREEVERLVAQHGSLDRTCADDDRIAVGRAEASRITGLSVSALERRCARGMPPLARKVGGRVLYPLDSLKQWVAQGDRPVRGARRGGAS